jgi:hypothetical protein
MCMPGGPYGKKSNFLGPKPPKEPVDPGTVVIKTVEGPLSSDMEARQSPSSCCCRKEEYVPSGRVCHTSIEDLVASIGRQQQDDASPPVFPIQRLLLSSLLQVYRCILSAMTGRDDDDDDWGGR